MDGKQQGASPSKGSVRLVKVVKTVKQEALISVDPNATAEEQIRRATNLPEMLWRTTSTVFVPEEA